MKILRLLQCSFLLLLLILFSELGMAQRKISGSVQDAKSNSPLEGATISLKNSKVSTISKPGGKFEISVPNGKAILTVSFVGFQTQTVTVAESQSNVQIALHESTNQLNDVVIVGVQAQSRRKTTSAISTVLAKDIQYLPSPSVDNLLQGRVAGLDVQISSGEPGVTPTVVVRGNSKLSTNISDNNVALAHALSGPLYVIDGVPTNPEDISNIFDATGTDFLAGININDIASVDVQKDAAATAAW